MTGWDDTDAPLRRASRVILLDGAGNTLLLHYVDAETCVDPLEPDLIDYWCNPGGGLEPGETFEDAAHRELYEETGFQVTDLAGPVVRRRYPLLIRGGLMRCEEHLFVARLDALRPEPDISRQNADELEPLEGLAWWSLDELSATGERLFPGELPRVVAGWLAGTLGPVPLDLP